MRDETSGAQVALKILHRQLCDDEKVIDRFLVEVGALTRLRHPHIVELLDYGWTGDGRPYYTMPWLRGATLAAVIEKQPPSLDGSLLVIAQVLDGLGAAHALGIVHRDVKPANIIIERPRGRSSVRLLDFGVARLLESSESFRRQFATTGVVGTPIYLSPEGARGDAVDCRADLYSVGILLYRMLAGRYPWDASGWDNWVNAHLHRQVVPPSRFASWLPKELDAAVLRALEKDPSGRWQTAKEFRLALLQLRERILSPGAWLATTYLGPKGGNPSEGEPQPDRTGDEEPPHAKPPHAEPPHAKPPHAEPPHAKPQPREPPLNPKRTAHQEDRHLQPSLSPSRLLENGMERLGWSTESLLVTVVVAVVAGLIAWWILNWG